jgi:hypothetical protein
MSKMIPQAAIDTFRQHQNVSVDNYGISCDLYIPSNLEDLEEKDIYVVPTDHTFIHYTTLVWVEWSPTTRRLRDLGIFVEGELPILARFKTEGQADDGTIQSVDVLVNSYIKVPLQYVPDKFEKTDEFEIVDLLTGPFHDATLTAIYKLAPKRTP